MSRIIWKFDFACIKNAVRANAVRLSAVHTNAVQIRRSWICFPMLVLAMHLGWSSPSLAQQNDRSILVFEGARSSAGSNAQVEVETQSPEATGSTPTFSPMQATQPFLPPPPPAGMTVNSDNAASFRQVTQGTLTAATRDQTTETRSAVELLRATLYDDANVQATSATQRAPDSGTFASRLPGGAQPTGGARSLNGSGLQGDNSFGSSPASSSLRSNPTNSTSRNRFGNFGESPASTGPSRFGPLSSNQGVAGTQNATAPPAQPAKNRFAAPPAVVPASAQEPFKSAPSTNRLGSPASAPNQPSRMPVSQSIATPPVVAPPVSPRPTPQANTQSFASPNISAQANRGFPRAPEKFASPTTTNNLGQSNLRQTNSFGGSSSQGDSSSSSLRSLVASGAGSNSERSSTPMIKRQASGSSSSSFRNSAVTSQSSSGSSRLAQQSSGFASQSRQQPLRGNSINRTNDLRNNSSNTQRPAAQRPAAQRSVNRDQSDGKADRASISFAQQQLRNIQPVSAGASGTPIRLQELFLEPLSGSQRKKMVAQYWETYYDLAALKIASDYESWLNSISTSGAEQGLLTTAQRMASDQKLAAKIQLGKSQSRLLDFMPNPRPNEFAPLPADEPLVEHYVTDYEKYKRVRTLPTSLRGIDPMLASTLKLITQRARTVSMAKDAVDQAGRSVRNQQIPLASAIAAGELWRESQLDMVASTVSYNQAISDFVLTLEPNRSPEQLTAFMLGAPKNGSQSSAVNSQNQSPRNASNQLGFPLNRQ